MPRHLVTSALPYINGVKHLGNLVGSMLPADVSARYLRAAGHEVLAICATDEHGTPAELAFGPDGSLYVVDAGNMRIRRIQDPTGPTPTIEAFAGLDGLAAFAALSSDVPAETTRAAAAFAFPAGLCVDPAGNVYVAEFGTLALPLSFRAIGAVSGLAVSAYPASASYRRTVLEPRTFQLAE